MRICWINFLGEKQSNLDTGDITQTTSSEYETTCEVIHAHFRKHRSLDGLTLDDFTGLRKALAKGKIKNTLSPATQKRRLTVARMIFTEQPVATYLAETAVYRMKNTFGSNLKNQKLPNQLTEVALRCKIQNLFVTLGMTSVYMDLVSRQGPTNLQRTH